MSRCSSASYSRKVLKSHDGCCVTYCTFLFHWDLTHSLPQISYMQRLNHTKPLCEYPEWIETSGIRRIGGNKLLSWCTVCGGSCFETFLHHMYRDLWHFASLEPCAFRGFLFSVVRREIMVCKMGNLLIINLPCHNLPYHKRNPDGSNVLWTLWITAPVLCAPPYSRCSQLFYRWNALWQPAIMYGKHNAFCRHSKSAGK